MNGRPNEPPLPEPLAYFLTWPTYGTWLPGDERGWVEYRKGWQLPDPIRKRQAEARMTLRKRLIDRDKHMEDFALPRRQGIKARLQSLLQIFKD